MAFDPYSKGGPAFTGAPTPPPKAPPPFRCKQCKVPKESFAIRFYDFYLCNNGHETPCDPPVKDEKQERLMFR